MKRIHRALLTTAIIGGFGLGGGLYVYVSRVRTADQRQREENEASRLFVFGRNDVERATIFTHGATVTFERIPQPSGPFKIVEPFTWEADQAALSRALDYVAVLRLRTRTIEHPSAEDLKKVGLDRPELGIRIVTSKGALGAFFGPRNTLVDAYPVTDLDRTLVGLTDPPAIEALDRPISVFREKRLFPVAADEIRDIDIYGGVLVRDGFVPNLGLGEDRPTSSESHLSLSLAEDGRWMVNSPSTSASELADEDAVRRLLVVLTKRLRVEEFLTDTCAVPSSQNDHVAPASEQERIGACGLAGRVFLVTFRVGKEGKRFSAIVGDKIENASIYEGAAKNKDLAKNKDSVREEGTNKNADRDQRSQGANASANANTQGEREGDEAEGSVGRSMFLHRADTRTLVSVPGWVKDEIARPIDRFQDRTMARFEEGSVARVEFHLGGPSIIAERVPSANGTSDWRLVAPEQKPAKAWKMDSIVRLFSRLKATQIYRQTATAEELSTWRLEPPEREIIIQDSSGAVLADIAIGHSLDEETRFVSARNQSRVGLILDTKLAPLPKTSRELTDEE